MVAQDGFAPPATVRRPSSLEKCCFACHCLLLPLGFVYILWVFVPEEDLEDWNITYHPRKEWSLHIPVTLFCLFLATPILYCGLNASSVPDKSSPETLTDSFARRRPMGAFGFDHSESEGAMSGSPLPNIYDIEPWKVKWHENQ